MQEVEYSRHLEGIGSSRGLRRYIPIRMDIVWVRSNQRLRTEWNKLKISKVDDEMTT